MLRRFECPTCRKFLGRSDGTVLETKCRRCESIVVGLPAPLQVTLECPRCGRRQYQEAGAVPAGYCVRCGAGTLRVVPALAREPVHA